MKKQGSRLIAVIIAVVAFCALVAVYFLGLNLSGFVGAKKYIIPILLTGVGLICSYALHSVLHELGHALFACFSGCKVTEVSLLGFTFSKGVKFTPSSAYAGWVEYCPKTADEAHAVKAFHLPLLGGLIGSVLSLFWVLIPLLTSALDNYVVYYLFIAGGIGVIYAFSVNWLTFAPTTDGFYVFSRSKARDELVDESIRTLHYQASFYNGKSAVESGLIKTSVSAYFDVLKSLELGDSLEANRLIAEMQKLDYLPDNQLIALLLEEFYLALINVDESEAEVKRLCELVSPVLDENSDELTVLRVTTEYHRYLGEIDWANALEKTFLKSCDSHTLSGYGKTQKAIYLRYRR